MEDSLQDDGAYDGVNGPWIPDRAYHASDRVSRSQIVVMHARTPKHYRWLRDNPSPPTRAMVCGRQAHALVLEPERFAREYVFPPAGTHANTIAGREAWWEFLAESGWDVRPEEYTKPRRKGDDPRVKSVRITMRDGAKEVVGYDPDIGLSMEDSRTVLGIRDSLESSPTVMGILRGPGYAEATYCATIETVRVRVRIDRVNLRDSGAVLVDLKTAANNERREYQHEVGRHHLHIQAGIYSAVFAVATGVPVESFAFVVYEKSPPYAARIYTLRHKDMADGEAYAYDAIRKIRDCRLLGEWPDGSEVVEEITVPGWAGLPEEDREW